MLPDLATAATRLNPGDVLDVYPAPQPHAAVRFTRAGTAAQPITVRGIAVNGQRPLVQGGSASATGFAAVYFAGSHHLVVEGLDISNGIDRRRPDGSLDTGRYATPAQCIKHEAHAVTLRDVRVFACPNHGILGTDTGSGSLTLQRTEVTRSGCNPTGGRMQCDDGKHPIYVATDLQAWPDAVLRIEDSWIHDNHAGESIKSRAHRVEVYTSWIATTGPHEARAFGLYGHDEVRQASLQQPIHHDIVGNVILVDANRSDANSVLRFGSDFDLGDRNADTYGRTRLVNNTLVVSGSLATGAAPLVRAFGRPEGFIAHNNLVVTVGEAAPRVLFLHEDDGNLQWAAPDGRPRVLMTHNALPAGSTLLRTRSGQRYDSGAAAPAGSGYAWSNTLDAGSTPLPQLGADFEALRPAALRPPAGWALRGTGTTATHLTRHPVDADRAFEIPGALPLPPRTPAPGRSSGPARADTPQPTPGAMD